MSQIIQNDEQHSPEVIEALETEGELTEAQTSSLLVEAGYAEDTLATARAKAPEKADARGADLARKVQAAMRRPEDVDLGETKVEAEAWQAVIAAHAEYGAAVRSLKAIEEEKAEEDKTADDVVAEQLRAGKAPKAPKGRDWLAEERTRRAVVRVAAEAVVVARAAYDRVAEVERPKRSAGAIERLKSAEAEMRKAAPGALASVAEWLLARDLALAIVEKDDVERADLGVIDRESAAVLSAGRKAVPALRALLESPHPVVTGRHTFEKFDVDPPLHVREWLAQSDAGINVLAVIEVRESEAGHEVTRLARPLWSRVHPDDAARGLGEWRRSRLRN